jgi:ATP-binding cassette subfamily F protein 3
MIICATDQLGKMHGGDWIFRNINCEIQEGERTGIVGKNGSGKTTLLHLLAGIESPNEGQIFKNKNIKTAYLQQLTHYTQETTVRQILEQSFTKLKAIESRMKQLEEKLSTIDSSVEKGLQRALAEYQRLQEEFERSDGYAMESRILMVSQGLGLDHSMLDQSFSSLSGGEQKKVGLATVLLQNAEILLLDEPTNHLDLSSIEWLEDFLNNYKGAVMVVSHDRYFLDRIVHKVVDIEEGEVMTYQGNYSSFLQQKEEHLLAEFKNYQEQQKKIKKMKEAIKRLKDWANRADNEDLHRKAKNMQRALDRMDKVKRPILERRKMGLSFEAESRSGQDVITLEKISKSYGNKDLFQNLDAHIRFQDRVAIVGENGCGKSTLLKIILGDTPPDFGKVKIGSGVKAGYLSQLGIEGYDDETVLEAFRDQVSIPDGEARHILARFLFYGPAVFRKVKNLSGGERMRLRLAQLMYQDINLLVLDEPTNHLDIDSCEVLEETLEEFTGTIVAISHDRYFLNKLFDQIYWLENESLTLYLGHYDEANRKRTEKLRSR